MIRIRPMTIRDVPLGMRLKQQAGWNQTEADWSRFLDLEPDGCFVAEPNSEPVATTTTCIFGSVAWVAMVLVEATVRGHGIGTAMMQHALAFLDGRGVRSIRLDATPLGQPIYEKLGFAPQYQLARFEGKLPQRPPASAVRGVQPEELSELLQLDQRVTGTDRRKLLLHLFTEAPSALRVVKLAGGGAGYLTTRQGSRAVQVGPCLAAPAVGRRLFADACNQYAGRLAYLDIPTANAPAMAEAEAIGLTVQRHFVRMCRGEPVNDRIEWLWASSGPEMG